MTQSNVDPPDGAGNGNGHSIWSGAGSLDLVSMNGGSKGYERLTSTTGAPETHQHDPQKEGGEGPPVTVLNKYVIACAIMASLNSVLLGYDAGIMSGAVLFIREDLKITEWQEEMLVGSLSIVSLVGSLSAGRTADVLGRRWTMIIAQIFFLVGAVTLGLAPSFEILMVGRVFAGIGVGFALMVAPVYTAEVSPASSRGSLVSLPEVFINVGILLGYICSYVFSGLPARLSWRLMLGLGGAPSLFLICAVLLMPESPRWLVMQYRFEEAEKVLIDTSGDKAEADLRLAEIIEAAGLRPEDSRKPTWPGQGIIEEVGRTRGQNDGQGVWRELFCPTPAVRRMLILVLGLQFFQQSTGIDALVYYSPAVLNGSGLTSNSASIGATVAIGFSKTVFIAVATIWLDSVGRRPLLITSITGMTVSLGVLALGFKAIGVTSASSNVLPNGVADAPLPAPQGSGFAPVLSVLTICTYVGFFSIGMGPVLWVVASEVFPSRLRAQAMGLGIVVNRLVSGIVSSSFLSLVDATTLAGTFFIFSCVSLTGTIFIYCLVPETKGKTLEDVAKLFERAEVLPTSELGAMYAIESGEDVVDSEAAFHTENSRDGEEVTLIAHDPNSSSTGG